MSNASTISRLIQPGGDLISNAGEVAAGGTETYATIAELPLTGNTVGDFGFTSDTKSLYVWDGTEWDRVYTGFNDTPRWTVRPPSSLQLSLGAPSYTLTTAAVDPEGFPITYGVDVHPSNQSQATITNNNDGTFAILPTTNISDAGNFTARFTASDGLQTSSVYTTINIPIMVQYENLLGFYDFTDSNSYSGSGTSLIDLSSAGNNQTIAIGSGSYLGSGSGVNGVSAFSFASNTTVDFLNIPSTVKTIILIATLPPSQWVVFGDGSSNFLGVVQQGSTSDLYGTVGGYSANNFYINGTIVPDRGAAWTASDNAAFNSYSFTGVTAPRLLLNGYPTYNSSFQLQAAIFWDVDLTAAEIKSVHEYFSGMTTWSGA